MDRRHGKRPVPPQTSEEKSKGRVGAASADMTAMVAALTQAMGSDEQHGFSQSSAPASAQSAVVKEAAQDQGTYIFDYNSN